MRRHDATIDDTTEQSGYVGLARTITVREGVVALIAVGLVAFLCFGVWARLGAIEKKMDDANLAMGAFVATHAKIEQERARLAVTQINIERLVCISVAKDDATRRECGREASVEAAKQ